MPAMLKSAIGMVALILTAVGTFARAGYRVIAFDRRGFGKSIADPATGPQRGTIAGDLDALADHLKLDRFHLLGVAGADGDLGRACEKSRMGSRARRRPRGHVGAARPVQRKGPRVCRTALKRIPVE
jgi:hypothetical protein